MLKRFVLPAAVAAVLAMPSLGLAQQPSKLRFASFIPDGISTTGVFMPFIESVNKQSKGTLQIEFFGNGALGRNPMQQPQMVLDGVADLAWVILPQTRGRFRETEVLELPTLFKDVTDCTSVASRLQVRNKFGGFDDFYVVGIVGTGPMSIHSRGQITSLNDIKGKKIRAASALESETIKALGGVPVALTINEIVEAVGRGSIDGVTSLPSMLFDLGFASVTNTHYFTRLGNLPMAILMNKQKFDSLQQPAQDAIRKHSGEWLEKTFNAALGPYDASLIQKLKDDPKRKVIFPSDEELARTRQLVQPVINSWTEQSPRHAELYQELDKELAQVHPQ